MYNYLYAQWSQNEDTNVCALKKQTLTHTVQLNTLYIDRQARQVLLPTVLNLTAGKQYMFFESLINLQAPSSEANQPFDNIIQAE